MTIGACTMGSALCKSLLSGLSRCLIAFLRQLLAGFVSTLKISRGPLGRLESLIVVFLLPIGLSEDFMASSGTLALRQDLVAVRS